VEKREILAAAATADSPARYRMTSRRKEGATKEKIENFSSTDPYKIKMMEGGKVY
jgi:hypothetical protein